MFEFHAVRYEWEHIICYNWNSESEARKHFYGKIVIISSLPTMSSGKDWWRTDDGSSTKWSFSWISYQGYLPWVLILNSWLTSNNSGRQAMGHFTTLTWFIESCICVFWRCCCIKVYLIWNWLVICNIFQSNPMKKI